MTRAKARVLEDFGAINCLAYVAGLRLMLQSLCRTSRLHGFELVTACTMWQKWAASKQVGISAVLSCKPAWEKGWPVVESSRAYSAYVPMYVWPLDKSQAGLVRCLEP